MSRGLSLWLWFVAGALGCSGGTARESPARHVVFISLDTTRADHFGFYGNTAIRTPHLDRLAAESIVLDDFMTVAPTTLSSHASLFTGKYPHSHGAPRNGFVLDQANVTLAELLRDNGFAAAGFVGAFPLSARFGIDQGFERWDEEFERFKGRDGVLQNERSAAAVTDAVLRHLDATAPKPGRFLFVHYFDPHVPYEPPAPYDTLYDARGRAGLDDWKTQVQACAALPVGQRRTAQAERMAAQYAGEIGYLDEQVGRLLDGLRERGILDDALLVVTSDHGETFWEDHECFDHGWGVHQTTVRALGLIRLPGAAKSGTRVAGVVANIDLLPTVLEYLGIAAPAGIDGEPLRLASDSLGPSGAARFSQATKPWEEVETDSRWRNMHKARCIRAGRHKLIQVPYAGFEELFDLVDDPGETRNLLDRPGAEELAGPLRQMLESWAASAHPLPTHFVREDQDEVLERLRSLGYVGGEARSEPAGHP